MNQPKLKVGIIGTGVGRAVHLPGFQQHPETAVVAVWSQTREAAEATAAEFNVPHAFDDYRAMLAMPDLDVVSITTPPHLHYEITMAALAAGKHVLCEKPMALNARQAEEMLRAADEAGRVGMINHEFRYIPSHARVKELLDDGFIGEPRSVTITWIDDFLNDPVKHPWGWLSQRAFGGGALGAVGSHALDHILWWFGDIARCSGRLKTLIKARQIPGTTEMRAVETDDWFAATVEFLNGAEGIVNGTIVAAHGTGIGVEIQGADGALVLDRDGQLLGARRGEGNLELLPIPERLMAAPGSGDRRIDFLWLVERLVRAIRHGDDPGPSFRDGVRTQRVMDAITASSREERWMAVGSTGGMGSLGSV